MNAETSSTDVSGLAIPCCGQGLETLKREIATFRRELPRLLAEGEANRYAVLQGDQVVGLWDTQQEALQTAQQRFGLNPFAVVRIDPRFVPLLQRVDFPLRLSNSGSASAKRSISSSVL
jgi:hypothetical protein